MTLQLKLSAELEERLRREAARRGEATESVALRVLDEHLPPTADDRRQVAMELLQAWMKEYATMSAEDEAENAAVLHALDEDRGSPRKLFISPVAGNN